ncbi:CLUMA_CG019633, isoform A [Clunio marinus]|uniref:CLUMA_CG019633, isoform A n=1 Tax=Clunio marinus TaxID=568069 RepID=A0A1J1J2K2_9DIPT|nr:CLUMA_CG019633, isoform A [Clunio marinus]
MNENRKRVRSEEENLGLQLKCFINQRRVDQTDDALMKKVYEKTLKMIYEGASSEKTEKTEKTTEISYDKEFEKPPPKSVDCVYCWRSVEGKYLCKNCNLHSCERCVVDCIGCEEKLCNGCVKIFGCSVEEIPTCEDCKAYLY